MCLLHIRMLEHLPLSEYVNNPEAVPALTLQNFNPADPMEPALRDVKPFSPEVLTHLQTEVNRILG